ncbi:disulfide bond formation protein B [Spectribacter hydrogenooxidans]|uniref:Disulfide bond formation protein B n=1 Tax=Spectribacter hydrogenoxidans TaxID=3075608 RepID=A0ABU3C288_9GAMM|nr:disulfide bond formation protein B [Salinisphaera sp. W335]MDT0635630.1 disulfide bond formation protein B [Salinisphaera sp. W335]
MTPRRVMTLGLLASAAALAFAYLLEFGFGLEPCPLCIFQRVAMAGVALVCLAGALHGPLGWGRHVYFLLATASAGVGAAIAGRHVWLQSLPADQVPACGPDLNYLLDVMPWAEVLAMVLRGDASCADIDAAFMGLSLPAWTLVGFVLLLAGLLWGWLAARRAA